MAELQLRGRAGTLQGRVCWPGRPPAGLLVFCAPDTGWRGELSAATGLVVLSVTGGLDEAMTAADWAAEHASSLDADPAGLLIGGSGAGGPLAAAVAREAAASGWPAFRRQILICAHPVRPAPPVPSLNGLAPATVVTVDRDPAGDGGEYAALLRSAGVAVEELRHAAADAACAVQIRNSHRLLASLGAALNGSEDA